MTESREYVLFYDETDIFSNFYPVKVLYAGKMFDNTEQAFMYCKAIHFKDFDMAKSILKVTSPSQAKQMGRMVKGFEENEWTAHAQQYMYDVNYAKFTQNSILLDGLLRTRGKVLVEASPTDRIWGIGLKKSDPRALDRAEWKGENLLGFCLTELRDNLLSTVTPIK